MKKAENIGLRGRKRRQRMGIISFLSSAILMLVLFGAAVPRAWRLLLFIFFFAGGLGLLQAREKT